MHGTYLIFWARVDIIPQQVALGVQGLADQMRCQGHLVCFSLVGTLPVWSRMSSEAAKNRCCSSTGVGPFRKPIFGVPQVFWKRFVSVLVRIIFLSRHNPHMSAPSKCTEHLPNHHVVMGKCHASLGSPLGGEFVFPQW